MFCGAGVPGFATKKAILKSQGLEFDDQISGGH